MVKCDSCGLVYANPRYASPRRWLLCQSWSFKDSTDSGRISGFENNSNFVQNIAPKLKILSDRGYAGDDFSLIDAGCGTGVFLKNVKDAGFDACGIEPGWFSARYARNRHGLKVYNTDLLHFRNADKFDVVTCLHVIEHVHNPLEFAIKLRNLVSNSGMILIATPNLGCKYAQKLGIEWEAWGPADHLSLFDKETLSELLKRAGINNFEIITTGDNQDELIAICGVNK